MDSLKATLGAGAVTVERVATSPLAGPSPSGPVISPTATVVVDPQPTLKQTAFVPATGSSPSLALSPQGRTTVLPRRKATAAPGAPPQWHEDVRPRYERLRILGRGGMGEVELVSDHDINRKVALKRVLLEAQGSDAVLRFADEVRAIGQLEHPGIVPIYDVGIDEAGQHYLVMKNVQGETLEAVIKQLQAGNPIYLDRFSHEYRTHIFLEILQAIRYAHNRGILHRDLKPANIMVGRFGEVTIMDWGLAKEMNRQEPTPLGRTGLTGTVTTSGRLLETAAGALLGTPLYMSPEQAAGDNDALDERSDIFTLCILFYEFLALEHPLAHLESVRDLLAALTEHDLPLPQLMQQATFRKGAPAELVHILVKGLARDRDQRYRSVAELEDRIRSVISGKMKIQCHVTLAKRLSSALVHWIDRHALLYSLLFLGWAVASLAGLIYLVVAMVHAL